MGISRRLWSIDVETDSAQEEFPSRCMWTMTTNTECRRGGQESAVLTAGLRPIVASKAKFVRHQCVGILGIVAGLAVPLPERRMLDRGNQ